MLEDKMTNQPKRPLTQRELRKQKAKVEQTQYVTIINRSSTQTVPIQLKAPPGQDFYVGEATVPLYPKRMAKFPQDRLYAEQIENFQKQGRIQVLNAS
jgi:hypothetical protein